MSEKKKEACIWNRRGNCHGMVEKLTSFLPDDWSKTKPGKALESDYSVKYCQLCLMSKLIEQIENLNENIEKLRKKSNQSF